jgi:NodT family efflux transporter outer membrane factor (OMF) lipoprotein
LPSLDLQGNAIQNRQSQQRPLRGSNLPDNYASDQVNGALAYEVDLWGKIRNEVRSRRALAQASDADRAAIQISLEAQLAGHYAELRGLDDDILLLDRTVAAYQQSHALTQILFKGKIAAQMDVSRASVQLDNALTAAAQARADRALMEHAIAVLVGETPSSFDLTPAITALPLPAIPTGIPATLLQRRPDIAAAERALAAASLRIGIARAAFYPSLTFDALGGVMSEGSDPFRVGDLFWALGPGVDLPLFTGGKLKGQLAQAQANFREASAHYRATSLRAFQDVEDNRALLARLAGEAQSSQDAAAAAQQTATAALALYTNGATSYLDVVTAQTALLEAQRAVLDIRTRRVTASVGLIRALGGGWINPSPPPHP